jgi:hypothetical protein
MIRWVGHVGWIGERRNEYKILVGKPERKRPLRRPRSRWEDNRMDIIKICQEVIKRMHLAEDRGQCRVL